MLLNSYHQHKPVLTVNIVLSVSLFLGLSEDCLVGGIVHLTCRKPRIGVYSGKQITSGRVSTRALGILKRGS